jgi:hypothetical protein
MNTCLSSMHPESMDWLSYPTCYSNLKKATK